MLSSTLSFDTLASRYCLGCCFDGRPNCLCPTWFGGWFLRRALTGSDRSPRRSGLVLHFLDCSLCIYFCFWKPKRLSFIFSAESCYLEFFVAKFFWPGASTPVAAPLRGDNPQELLGTSSKMTLGKDLCESSLTTFLLYDTGPKDGWPSRFLLIRLIGFLTCLSNFSFSKWVRSCSVFILELEDIEFGVEITSSWETS